MLTEMKGRAAARGDRRWIAGRPAPFGPVSARDEDLASDGPTRAMTPGPAASRPDWAIRAGPCCRVRIWSPARGAVGAEPCLPSSIWLRTIAREPQVPQGFAMKSRGAPAHGLGPQSSTFASRHG